MEFRQQKNIAQQIAESITDRILTGEFDKGKKLPSVRELASEIGVNPNTIVKSFDELQRREIIINKRGVGYYVNSKSKDIIMDWRKDEFFKINLPSFIHQVKVLGIDYERLTEQLKLSLKDENKKE